MTGSSFPRFGDVAHLGHIELFTPTPDETLSFLTSVVGRHESGRQGNSVYLRVGRLRVAPARAHLILDPDWKPVIWTQAERAQGQAWESPDRQLVAYARNTAGAGSGIVQQQFGSPGAHT